MPSFPWGMLFLALIVGYLIGSVLFAVPVARYCGVDIFKVGSGNPGATNVKRSVGKKAGNIVFVCDALKGFLATAWPALFFSGTPSLIWLQLAGFAGVVVGHSFSCYYRFRGGKAVSCTIGGLVAVMPLAVLAGVIVWLAVFYASRYVSLASLALGLSLPIATWGFGMGGVRICVAALVCVLLFVRHRSNIERLLKGTESRFERKKRD